MPDVTSAALERNERAVPGWLPPQAERGGGHRVSGSGCAMIPVLVTTGLPINRCSSSGYNIYDSTLSSCGCSALPTSDSKANGLLLTYVPLLQQYSSSGGSIAQDNNIE